VGGGGRADRHDTDWYPLIFFLVGTCWHLLADVDTAGPVEPVNHMGNREAVKKTSSLSQSDRQPTRLTHVRPTGLGETPWDVDSAHGRKHGITTRLSRLRGTFDCATRYSHELQLKFAVNTQDKNTTRSTTTTTPSQTGRWAALPHRDSVCQWSCSHPLDNRHIRGASRQ
jgi:hypothetical protein